MENDKNNLDGLGPPASPGGPLEDELLPAELNSITLEQSSNQLVKDIVETDNIDELKTLAKLFEINQAKKNAIRIVKLNSLLDKVNDQAIERFEKRPYEISNKELLDYMKVVQEQIQSSQETLSKIDQTPAIQINQQNNSINVNVGDNAIDRDSKERVIDAVTALLKAVRSPAQQGPVTIDVTEKE